jgi:hypothetical protein
VAKAIDSTIGVGSPTTIAHAPALQRNQRRLLAGAGEERRRSERLSRCRLSSAVPNRRSPFRRRHRALGDRQIVVGDVDPHPNRARPHRIEPHRIHAPHRHAEKVTGEPTTRPDTDRSMTMS